MMKFIPLSMRSVGYRLANKNTKCDTMRFSFFIDAPDEAPLGGIGMSTGIGRGLSLSNS